MPQSALSGAADAGEHRLCLLRKGGDEIGGRRQGL